MIKFLFAALCLLAGMANEAIAHPAYHIKVRIPSAKDSTVYLVNYYGRPLPTIYKRDSARFDKNGVAEFKSDDTAFTGGIYIILLGDRKTYFELLLNRGDDMTVTADISKLPEGLKFKNSPENERFQEYVSFLAGYGKKQEAILAELKTARSAADSAAIRKKAGGSGRELINYRKDYVKRYPNTLLSKIFQALEMPEVPEGQHLLADGKTKDSTFAYRYYKAHFWDGFDLTDDRLIHTPIYDARLDEYFNKLVLPWPDSVEKEADELLHKTRETKDLFKYTLWWVTRNVENSKVMGMDEAFVYLVENYYMKGDAFWLTTDELNKYLDRAQKIAPNVIGNLGPEVKLASLSSPDLVNMQDVKAKYTLLVFYSPTCGHCQKELPEIDSAYNASLKAKGVKVYTVATEGDEKTITDFIAKNHLEEWTNTWDHDHVGDWRGKYDVYSTPTIYLLDEKKIIKGKRLDHASLCTLVDMLEKKEKNIHKAKS